MGEEAWPAYASELYDLPATLKAKFGGKYSGEVLEEYKQLIGGKMKAYAVQFPAFLKGVTGAHSWYSRPTGVTHRHPSAWKLQPPELGSVLLMLDG